MRRSIWEKIREILNKHVLHGKWVRSVIALACIVTFITTYLLIMPAVTLSRAADCGQEEHTHTEDCYETESELTCGQEEHTHTEDCYDEKGSLICGMEEHVHDDGCYTFREVLVCGQEEHVHTEDCQAETEPSQEGIPEEKYEERPEEDYEEQLEEDYEEQPEESAAVDGEEEPQTGELRAEGEDYTITVSYSEEAGLPAGVSLNVKEITKKKEYESYKAQMEEELIDPESTKVTGARFFDITLEDNEGNELHPEGGVRVLIETKDTLQEDEEVQICHFDEEKDKPVEVESREVVSETYKVENLGVEFEAESFSVYGVVYTVDFKWEVNERIYEFSIHGGGKITLSELVEALGMLDATNFAGTDAFLKEVNDVTFSDENLVAVTKVTEDTSFTDIDSQVFDVFAAGGEEPEEDNTRVVSPDWILTSLAPFSSEETLVISMKNGDEITIDVTDDQSLNLADYVTDATLEIDGKTYGAGETWSVREGVDYALTLTFKEKGSRQFPQSGDEMVMEPADLDGMALVPGQSGTFDIPLGLYGTVTGNQWWVDSNGKIHIKFGDDPNNLLTRSNNAYFNLEFNVNFSGTEGQIQFNDNVVRDWEANTDTDVSISKSGHYNASTGKMEYTVTVTSTGKTYNVRVTDTFVTNNLLTLDQSSITISPDKELAATGNTTSEDGFTRVIKEMSHGETVTITYTADVNEMALGPNGTVTGDDGKNNVTVTDDNGDEDQKTNIVNEIKFSDLDKVSTSQTETSDGEIQMSWEIDANTERKASLVGSTISDRIDWTSKDIMKYVKSDGKVILHVVGTDADGNQYTRDIQVTPGDNSGQESWSWVVENIGEPVGTPLSYSITYDTLATRQTDNTSVKNNATNSSGGNDTGVGVVPGTNPGGGGGTTPSIVTEKEAAKVTEEYVDWNIVVNIPNEGLDKLEVIDTLPWKWLDASYISDGGSSFVKDIIEEPIEDNVQVSSTQQEYYSIDYDGKTGQNTAATLKINFFKDDQKSMAGVNGPARTVTITIRTKNDPRWLDAVAAGYTAGSMHDNYAWVNSHAIDAHAAPVKRTVVKKFLEKTTNSEGLPRFQYEVILSGVNSVQDFSFTDTFNSEYLKLVEPRTYQTTSTEYQISGNDYPWQWNKNGSYIQTEQLEPGKIRFYADSIPLKEDQSTYGYYRITYFLEVKDADALAALESQAIKNGGKYTLGNTAVWGNLTDDCDVDYEVKPVKKEGYFASANEEERKFTFVIDVNPSGFDLSSGDTVELTDQHTDNLSVDYSSVKIYKIPEGTIIPDAKAAAQSNQLQSAWLCAPRSIPWNFDGNDGTFTLEDQTHYVIVYDAIVIGSGNQPFRNDADLEGFTSYKEGSKDYGNDNSGGGNVWEIKLLKYKKGMTSNGLQGATFQLFKGTGEYYQETDGTNTWWTEYKEPMKYGDTPNTRERGLVGKDVTFTTGSDGTVTIQLDQVRDGNEIEGGIHYYLKEIESPAGYQIDSSTEYWSFTLTTDPDEVNYGDTNRRDEYGNRQWIYFYYNDILKMANTETTNPLDVVVNKSWYDKYGNPITGQNLDESFVAKVQLMRKTDDNEYKPVKVVFGTDGSISSITDVESSTEESQIELTSDNNWSFSWDDLPRVEMGGDTGMEIIHRYAYKVEEVDVDGYVVSMSETETETVKTYALNNYATPDYKTTDITVNKVWQNTDGETIDGTTEKLPSEIQFQLYRAVSTTPFTRVPTTGGSLYVLSGDPHLVKPSASEGDDEYGIYTLAKSENWTTTFNNLPEVETVNGKTYYYAYYVKEIPLTGYTTTYLSDGTTRTIVNREPLDQDSKYINIGLEKNWTDGTNTTPPSGASATFTVHQQKATKSATAGNIPVIIVNDDLTTVVSSLNASEGDALRLDFTRVYSWEGSSVSIKNASGDWTKKYYYVNATSGCSYTVSSRDIVDGSITFKFDEPGFVNGCTVAPHWINTTSSAPSHSDYETTDFTRTITLPTTAGTWSTIIKDLIQEDADGNLYRYYITEDSSTPAASNVTFVDKDGNDIKDTSATGNQTTASLIATGQKVVVTNTYEEPETTDFQFTKEWHDIGDQPVTTWGGDITVTVQRRISNEDLETVGKYKISKTGAGFTVTKDDTTLSAPELAYVDDSTFTFKISDLPKNGMIGSDEGEYTYFVTEDTVSGYRDASYRNPSVSSDGGEVSWILSDEYALNNGKIINKPENSVELPHTGGPGTRALTILGVMLIALAGAGLVLRKRRREAAQGIKHL